MVTWCKPSADNEPLQLLTTWTWVWSGTTPSIASSKAARSTLAAAATHRN
eukprot:CAMPEP_0182543874 /NCGR_PEP_ID=MMETSP1323-20130603/32290_1 /TAXON_ID=236787 /ORGANISM="Florenciella parvula, Strain RCC1693" /LENGTH=49 /DNA_ID=CAMNT_0024754855 /DNA_START=51 /DNA_END=200 /DNA_ORIENTATION=+